MAPEDVPAAASEASSGNGQPPPAADATAPRIEAIYTALVNVRNTELSVYYTRYNIQAVINFGLIAAVLATAQDSAFLSPLPLWIVLGGATLSLVWLGFAIVGKRLFTERWEGYLRRYEREILAPQGLRPDLQMFTHVAADEQSLDPWRRNWRNLNVLTRLVPLMALTAWAVIGWSAWFVEPLNGRISRLEASVTRLEQSEAKLKDINARLDALDSNIREILQQLPRPAAREIEKQGQTQSAIKPR